MPTPRRLLDFAQRGWEHYSRVPLALRPIRPGPRHELDAPLIVSLTSHPLRFPTLHLTLRCLLNQSVSPDRLVLWIAHEDMARLPSKVLALRASGLEIRTCDDFRSFKKILPALNVFPDSYIVTADDDLYYGRKWLQHMVDAAMPGTRDIVATLLRRPKYVGGQMATVREWNNNATDSAVFAPSNDLLVLTGAGALFPARSLHEMVGSYCLIQELCPTCDDSWLAWMARKQGTKIRRSKAPKVKRLIAWRGTNKGSLAIENFDLVDGCLNQDEIFKRLSQHFGPLHRLKPPDADERP